MKNKIIVIALSLVLFLIPIVVSPKGACNLYIYRLVSLLVLGSILLIITILNIKKLKFDAVDKLILLFGVLAILSTIFSTNRNNSIIGEPNRYEGLLTFITYILIYYNAKYFFKKYKHFETIALLVYSAICILAIVQFYTSSFFKLAPLFGSGPVGTFGNTNFIGSFISLILPAFILRYIFSGKKRYLISSLLSFYVLIICVARSSWVAFAISILVVITYLIITRKKDFWKRFLVLITLFAICFCIINVTQGNQNKISQKLKIVTKEIKEMGESGISDKMGSTRIEIWKMTLKVICKYPILGCGVDSLKDGLSQACPLDNYKYMYTYNCYVDKAHNEYLHIASTIGLPALFIYLGFLSLIVIPNMQKALKDETSMLLFLVIISYLSQAFFNVSTIGIAPIFWFVLGIASKYSPCEKF